MIQLPKPNQVQRAEREVVRTTHIVGLLKMIPLIKVVCPSVQRMQRLHTPITPLSKYPNVSFIKQAHSHPHSLSKFPIRRGGSRQKY